MTALDEHDEAAESDIPATEIAFRKDMRCRSVIMRQIERAQTDVELAKAWDLFWALETNDTGHGSGDARHLLPCLLARNVKTVLCVGNGASLEAYAVAYAGYAVDVLDISPKANQLLREASPPPERFERMLGSEPARPGGSLAIHTGDFRVASLCTGPYDAIVVRRMLQYYPDANLNSAIQALRSRLMPTGLLVLESHNIRHSKGLYVQLLHDQGFSVCVDFQIRDDDGFVPRPLSIVRENPAAWVLSATG